MPDTGISKFNDNDNDDLLDLDNLSDGVVPSQTPPESFPFTEGSKSVEMETTTETLASPKPPMPKFRDRPDEEEISVENVAVETNSSSGRRVVDMRGHKDTSPIETSDKLTQYGDREEDKFIKGVKSAHGSDESQ